VRVPDVAATGVLTVALGRISTEYLVAIPGVAVKL
jgi:hypothetical protein